MWTGIICFDIKIKGEKLVIIKEADVKDEDRIEQWTLSLKEQIFRYLTKSIVISHNLD